MRIVEECSLADYVDYDEEIEHKGRQYYPTPIEVIYTNIRGDKELYYCYAVDDDYTAWICDEYEVYDSEEDCERDCFDLTGKGWTDLDSIAYGRIDYRKGNKNGF